MQQKQPMRSHILMIYATIEAQSREEDAGLLAYNKQIDMNEMVQYLADTFNLVVLSISATMLPTQVKAENDVVIYLTSTVVYVGNMPLTAIDTALARAGKTDWAPWVVSIGHNEKHPITLIELED